MLKLLSFLFFIPTLVFAKVDLSVVLKEEYFLPYENIEAELFVTNFTNQDLKFSQYSESNVIELIVKHNTLGKLRAKRTPRLNPITIQPSIQKRIKVSLNDYFEIFSSGIYSVTLSVKHSLLDDSVYSDPIKFSLLEENIEKESSFGLYDPKDDKIRSRNYQILSIRKQVYSYYYLRIYDEDWVYTQVKLGPKILGIKIYDEVDSFGNIHIFNQYKARHYYYYVFSFDGELRQKIAYLSTKESIPFLFKNYKTGQVSVQGGIKGRKFEKF